MSKRGLKLVNNTPGSRIVDAQRLAAYVGYGAVAPPAARCKRGGEVNEMPKNLPNT